MCAIVLAASLGACAGEAKAPGNGFANDKLTRAQIVATMAQMASVAAATGAQKPESCGDVSFELDCNGGGSIRFSCSGETVTITYDHCQMGNSTSVDGRMRVTSTSVEIDSVVVTYPDCDNSYEWKEGITVGATGNSYTYDLTISSGDDDVHVTAELTVSQSGTLGGNITYAGAFTATCNFNDTDPTCPAIADACGLVAADICNGDEFRNDVCPLGG